MSFSISKWVCPPPETFDPPKGSDGRVEWFRCLPYIAIHIAAIFAFFYPVTIACIVLAVVSYSIRMFTITAFYHRYFSHRTFKTSRIVQFIGAFIACSSGQRGPLWWAAHHRRHHRHSDTDEDVHSPHTKGIFWSHTLWFMTDYAVPTFLKEIPDLLKFKELRFLNRYDWVPLLALALGCYFLPHLSWFSSICNLSSMQCLLWGFSYPQLSYIMPHLQLIPLLICSVKEDTIQKTKAVIIGLYQFLHLEKDGITTIIFFPDLPGKVSLKVNLTSHIMD